jgi:four helix bundle protein
MYWAAEAPNKSCTFMNAEDRKTKIKSFEQLTVWQKSIEFCVLIYKNTDNFPSSEQFGLTNQLRRASSSISANIAEGFGRRTKNDKLHFYTIAYGSLLEVKSFLYLAQKLGYLNDISSLILNTADLQKLLNAFIASTRKM